MKASSYFARNAAMVTVVSPLADVSRCIARYHREHRPLMMLRFDAHYQMAMSAAGFTPDEFVDGEMMFTSYACFRGCLRRARSRVVARAVASRMPTLRLFTPRRLMRRDERRARRRCHELQVYEPVYCRRLSRELYAGR